jgi:hypothetical protein
MATLYKERFISGCLNPDIRLGNYLPFTGKKGFLPINPVSFCSEAFDRIFNLPEDKIHIVEVTISTHLKPGLSAPIRRHSEGFASYFWVNDISFFFCQNAVTLLHQLFNKAETDILHVHVREILE